MKQKFVISKQKIGSSKKDDKNEQSTIKNDVSLLISLTKASAITGSRVAFKKKILQPRLFAHGLLFVLSKFLISNMIIQVN